MDESRTSAGTRHRWYLIVPAVLGVLLVVAGLLGEARLGGFVNLLGWLPWAIPLGLVLLALACGLGVRRLLWAAVLASSLVFLALAYIGFAVAIMSALGGSHRVEENELYRVPSADGPGEVVVYQGLNIIDSTWELELRWGSGLTERRWDLGCVNSDLGVLEGVQWIGRDRLRVDLGDPVEIGLDGSTGRPRDQVSVGC